MELLFFVKKLIYKNKEGTWMCIYVYVYVYICVCIYTDRIIYFRRFVEK